MDLEPDNANTITDLKWQDWTGEDPGWTGLYKNRGVIRADSIYLSVYHFNLMSGCKREKTAMHELGHAHGFDHGPDNNVMYGVSKDICTLGSHDRQDYDDLWG